MSGPKDALSVPAPVTQSRVYQALHSLPKTLSRAARTARLTAIARGLSQYTQQSWLYRWLTKEPEPEVIVIDLRETWTVGPFIAILDWVIEHLAVAYRDSRLQQFNTAVQRRLYRAPVRFVSLFLVAFLVPFTLFNAAQTGVTTTTVVLLVLTVASGLGTLVDLSWPDLRETRLIQLLIAAFEPPEPPERDE